MTVEPSSAAGKRVHDSRTIYFCAKGCAEAFDKDPEKYLGPGALKAVSPAEAPPSPLPAGRSLRETRPSVAAGAEGLPSAGPGLEISRLPVAKQPPQPKATPRAPPGGRGGKQAPLFEIKGAKSAFLRKPPVKPAPDSPAIPPPPATSRVTLAIEGMHCASCVATIEGALAAVTGVTAASVNLATARAQVVGRGLNSRRLIDAVRTSGYDAKPAGEEEPGQADDRAARELRSILRRTLIAAALTLPVLVISM